MPLVKLPVSVRSYWISKRFQSVYFDGVTLDNLIYDNKLIEEKNTRVKITFTSADREKILQAFHQPSSDWNIEFEIDPLCSSLSKDKDGNKLTCFKSENANYHSRNSSGGL